MKAKYNFVAIGIFSSRWLQAPLYIGLIIAQAIYAFKFIEEVYHLILQAGIKSENEIMLMVLTLIDIVMVSNLLIMVIVGGYETFVSRLHLESHPDVPEWLDHVNANTMKIKLAMALIGISSIHILKTFIGIEKNFGVEKCQNDVIMWQIIIHITFLVSALAIAYTSKVAEGLAAQHHDSGGSS